MADRARAAAGALGVVALPTAWVSAGSVTDGFDPVRQSISQLQRDGTTTGVVMTAAFAAFATGGLLLAPVLDRRVGRSPAVALVLASVATYGAAVSPLGEVRGGPQDVVHLAFGSTGYVSLSVLPLLAARGLRGWARGASYVLGAVASACPVAPRPPIGATTPTTRRSGLPGRAAACWRIPITTAESTPPLTPTTAASSPHSVKYFSTFEVLAAR